MILSVSRRTDIPAFYSEWFMNRIREQYVCVKNPFNAHQVSKVPLTPNNVDCIVFWSKDPTPMLKYLDELDERGYKYYFQCTITAYGKDLEPDVRDKKEIINTLKKLSERLGKKAVVLRYDPIFLTPKYTKEYHLRAFRKLCSQLEGMTEKVIISFLDDYRKVSVNMKEVEILPIDEACMSEIAVGLLEIARNYGMSVETCAEKIELQELGIEHAACIDGKLIEYVMGCELEISKKDKYKKDNNREMCSCVKCIDIGEYDTCTHNCLYCYANVNKKRVRERVAKHNNLSSILIGEIGEVEVRERNPKDTKSFKKLVCEQMKL